jgi:mannose-6-phosphate isomerase-like protein (cupin superfamily)
MTKKVNLAEKLSQMPGYWKPRIIGQLNGQELKLAKLRGTFIWHHHENEDELLLCLSGRLLIQFRDDSVEIGAGDFCVISRGVEHCTSADEEAHVLVFEPIGARNTGNVEDPRVHHGRCPDLAAQEVCKIVCGSLSANLD